MSRGNSRHSGYARAEHDWYVETEACVDQLLDAVDLRGHLVWDPACGSGNILDRAAGRGLETIGSDLVFRDCRHSWFGLDFLRDSPLLALDFIWVNQPLAIVCNPPYGRLEPSMPKGDSYAVRYIRRALELGADRVAMLVQRTLLWSEARWALFAEEHPPTQLLFLSERPSMPPGVELPRLRAEGTAHKRGSMDYVWLYWERGAASRPPAWLRPSNLGPVPAPATAVQAGCRTCEIAGPDL